MIFCLIFCVIIKTVFTNLSKNWIPTYQNESTFDEPYDFVNVNSLPNFEKFGKDYDWISISGTSLTTSSYIAFTGTRNNNASNYESVFRKQSGIIILCSSISNSSNEKGFDINCQSLQEKYLESSDGKYFGAVVKSTKFKNDTIAFIYCDPLWFNPNFTFKISNGKCRLTLVKDFSDMKHIEYQVCDKFKKCLGGFSVDLIAIDNDLKILFGLPFENSTKLSNLVGSQEIKDGPENKGTYFNYGYSVAFSGDGSQFASSPVNDGHSPFVKMINIGNFYPTDISMQRYGGFGTSIDTVNVGNNLYGVIIGAPYQSKPNLVNVGAVFLACKGKNSTDVVFGENANDYFGYSVARLGDIDSNGPEEFVVSAPSLNFEKPGKIYIFSTTRHCQISKIPLQVYQSNINGFGIAISRGFDINFNGKPDFFVTALGYQKPFLFVMPNREKVTCSWIEQNKGDFITIENFKIKVIFQSSNIKYENYNYQVAIDFLNKGEPRFKLVDNDTVLNDEGYTMTLQPLLDVQDMDFKTVPLKVAIKGIRKCKISGVQDCFRSKTAQIEWLKCEKIIKLSPMSCSKINCQSELSIKSVNYTKGLVIYHGEKSDYQRKIEFLISNNGPDFTQRVFVSINSEPDIRIDNVRCDGYCKSEHITTQHTNIVIKDSMEKKDDFKISVDILYNELEKVNEKTSINFKIWSINDDDNINNNNYTLLYTVLFKPKLIISSKNTKENNIDSRIKPPYLERYNRISVQDLGTELSFSYLIQNKGPELKNVELKFLFPYKITSDKYILYLMDKIRLLSDESWENVKPSINNKNGLVKHCDVGKDMLNPLNVIGHKYNKKSDNLNRLKRSLEVNILNNLTVRDKQSNSDLNNNIFSSSRTSNIKCNESIRNLGYPICGEVTCSLNLIPKNSEFTFDFQAWLFTKTFFDARIPHLTILTTLEASLRDLPKGLKILKEDQFIGPIVASQNILFNKMKVDEDKPLPLWPIIVAIIIGIFLLVIIIVIAYYCGFFKRKRLRKERQKIRERATKNQETKDDVPLNSN